MLGCPRLWQYLVDCIISDAVDISDGFDKNNQNIICENEPFRDGDEESELSDLIIFDDITGDIIDDDVDILEEVQQSSESDEDNRTEELNIASEEDDSISLTQTTWYLEYLQELR